MIGNTSLPNAAGSTMEHAQCSLLKVTAQRKVKNFSRRFWFTTAAISLGLNWRTQLVYDFHLSPWSKILEPWRSVFAVKQNRQKCPWIARSSLMFLLHAENNTKISFHCFFFKPARLASFHGWCIKIRIVEATLHILRNSSYYTTIGRRNPSRKTFNIEV